MKLTDEQFDIVHHHEGPAIVYAVAGAGKSTTMAHRVRHLVRAYGAQPGRILVCSFSRETVADIRQKIEALGVSGVQCQTFNALGRKIVQQAVARGHWPAFDESQIEHRAGTLAMRALVELGRRHGKNFSALDVNPEDLQTFVSVCKGNLRYADLAGARLPPEVRDQASQARHDNAHYLQAYQIHEQLRAQHNWLTFDDQLLLGWEALVRFDDVRAWAKGTVDYLLVDEFQDVNRVQAQIADILTEDHRNYMAIGDDDQCIYEWRGADVRYILDFRQRYDAREYVISDNFRCPAEAALLAGQVIARNKQRHIKELVAQKGFGGQVVLKGFDYENGLAAHVVQEYQTLLHRGGSPRDAVVLVRSYSQTPAIEARLIQEGLAYQVVGSQRFYERPEVKALFTYLGFARQERDYLAQGGGVLSEQYLRRFADILRTPNRYLSNEWIQQVLRQGQQQPGSLVAALESQRVVAPGESAQKRLQQLVRILRGLQQRLTQPAGDTLSWLVSELDYLDALKAAAGLPELGEERCNNVRALVNYAQKKGSVLEFLDHLRRLYLEDSTADTTQPRLQIMSIHRSKGLEWPVVFVPSCADDQLPSANSDNLEEERRLLYVAITRCQRNLHLLFAPRQKMSIFLREVEAEQVLAQAEAIAAGMKKLPGELSAEDALALAQGIRRYPLARYLRLWWQPAPAQRAAWRAQAVLALEGQQDARRELAGHAAQLEELAPRQQAQDQGEKLYQSLSRRVTLFRARPVTVVLDQPAPDHGYARQTFRFEADGAERIVVRLAGGARAGVVDLKASRFPLGEISDWTLVEAQVSTGFRFSYLRRTMNLTLVLAKNAEALVAERVCAPPEPPARLRYLASDEARQDIERLLELL